jgi:hypothetical protein
MRSIPGLLVLAACGSGGGFPDARPIDAAIPGGTITLDWSVIDLGSQPVACDKIDAVSVTVLAHNRAFDGGLTQVFTCSTGTGTSQPMIPGTYDFDFELDAAAGTLPNNTIQLATAASQHTIEITSGGNVRLSPIVFQLAATGGLSLALNSGKSGGNCGLAAANGAGITSTTITLVHSSDQSCEPRTLSISASAITGAPASTYTVNCATPMVGPCIETDQAITASGVPADAYTIHVRGMVGAAACWSNNDGLQVPPLDLVLQRQLNLGFATGTPGC